MLLQECPDNLIERPVILIGFMGAGKSALAGVLSSRFCVPLVSTDEEIVRLAGKPVPKIFAEDGEAVFRRLETQVLKTIQQDNGLQHAGPFVLDCGGGIVLSEENRTRLRELGTVVWLSADADTVRSHLGEQIQNGERPLLLQADPGILIRTRRPYYEQTAELILEVKDKTPGELADELTARLRG